MGEDRLSSIYRMHVVFLYFIKSVVKRRQRIGIFINKANKNVYMSPYKGPQAFVRLISSFTDKHKGNKGRIM